jgi:hypothetical protein
MCCAIPVRVLAEARDFSLNPQRPDQPYGPPSFLFHGYRFSSGLVVKVTTRHILMPRLRMGDDVSVLPWYAFSSWTGIMLPFYKYLLLHYVTFYYIILYFVINLDGPSLSSQHVTFRPFLKFTEILSYFHSQFLLMLLLFYHFMTDSLHSHVLGRTAPELKVISARLFQFRCAQNTDQYRPISPKY